MQLSKRSKGFIFLLYFIIPSPEVSSIKSKKETHAWLRVCSPAGIFDIEPRVSCKKGIVFKEQFEPRCICLYGVWIVNYEMCDTSPYVLVGSGTNNCYTINFKISSIKFLGDPENAFATKYYVGPRSMTVFEEISQNGDWTRHMNLKFPVIIAINPDKNVSFEASNSWECFPQKEKFYKGSEKFRVQIWTSVIGPTKFRVVTKCVDPWNHGYDVYSTFLQPYFQSSNAMTPPINFCRPLCERKNFGPTKPTQTTPKTTTLSFLQRLRLYEDLGGLDEEIQETGGSKEIEAFLDEIISHDSVETINGTKISTEILMGSGGIGADLDEIKKKVKDLKKIVNTFDAFSSFEQGIIDEILRQDSKPKIKSQMLDNSKENSDEYLYHEHDSNKPDIHSDIHEEILPKVKIDAQSAIRSIQNHKKIKKNQANESWSKNKGVIKRRVKRRLEKVNSESVWGGRGLCIGSYWDPIDNFAFSPAEVEMCFPDRLGGPILH